LRVVEPPEPGLVNSVLDHKAWSWPQTSPRPGLARGFLAPIATPVFSTRHARHCLTMHNARSRAGPPRTRRSLQSHAGHAMLIFDGAKVNVLTPTPGLPSSFVILFQRPAPAFPSSVFTHNLSVRPLTCPFQLSPSPLSPRCVKPPGGAQGVAPCSATNHNFFQSLINSMSFTPSAISRHFTPLWALSLRSSRNPLSSYRSR
jgi:hypothetical protein